MMNARANPRILVQGLYGDISDGKSFYTGVIDNISLTGMSISKLPKTDNNKTELLSIMIEGGNRYFKLLLKQCWEIEDKENRTIGTKIQNSPWLWSEFVLQCQMRQVTAA
jgi:hypothetical protein